LDTLKKPLRDFFRVEATQPPITIKRKGWVAEGIIQLSTIGDWTFNNVTLVFKKANSSSEAFSKLNTPKVLVYIKKKNVNLIDFEF
jgi:hypothetical protein